MVIEQTLYLTKLHPSFRQNTAEDRIIHTHKSIPIYTLQQAVKSQKTIKIQIQ